MSVARPERKTGKYGGNHSRGFVIAEGLLKHQHQVLTKGQTGRRTRVWDTRRRV